MSKNPMSRTQVIIQHNEKMRDLFQSGKLCDIVLVTEDGVKIPVHKLILVNSSTYFDALLDGHFKESNENIIHIKEVDSNTLRTIITYMYSFEIELNQKNVKEILHASNFFHLEYAQELCCAFMMGNINIENCLQFMNTAKILSVDYLYQYCLSFVLKQFRFLIFPTTGTEYKAFYNTDLDDVVNIISSDSLEVDTEDMVFDFIIEWIECDKEKRIKHLPDLLKLLRIDWLSPENLKRIYYNPLIKENKQNLTSFIEKILSVKCFMDGPETKSRITYHDNKKIICIIRDHLVENPFSEYINLNLEGDWKKSKINLLCPRKRSKILAIEDKYLISICGQNENGTMSNKVYFLKLDSKDGEWQSIAHLNEPLSRFACCTDNKKIYIIGGSAQSCYDTRNSVLCYDLSKHTLTNITRAAYRNYLAAVCYNNTLIVFGGKEGQQSYSQVDQFDLNKRVWKQLQPMPVALHSMSSVLVENHVYIIGGCDSSNYPLKSAFEFNLTKNTWRKLSDMIFPRSMANSIVVKEGLFVFGDKRGLVKECELYDIKKNVWTEVKTAQLLHPYDCGNAVILSNKVLRNHFL